MKLEKMSEIKNVTRAQKTLQVLLTRPRSELVGLGLIYGTPAWARRDLPRERHSAATTSISNWKPR